MRTVVLLLAALVVAVGGSRSAPAQTGAFGVEVSLEEKIFLPGEDIVVAVRVSNLSGRPVVFGASTNWLTFYAESKAGRVVARLGQVPVQGEFTLESAKAGTKWWNLQPYFEFDEPGPYNLYAELRLPGWEERLVSEPVDIQIQPSRKIWEMAFGVPQAEGATNAAPEIRRYSLQSATRAKERKLYARVTDEDETRIFRVVLLDRLLSFANPEQQLDIHSRLHVLFQTSGNLYTHCVLDPNGTIVLRNRHEITPAGRPRLAKDVAGNIVIRGGRRFPTPDDVPPYVPPPQIAPTNLPPAGVVTNAPAKSGAKQKKPSRRRSEKEKTGSND